MTPKEAVQLVRFVAACCPQQQIDGYTPDAWFDVLGHLDLTECREAVTSVVRRKPFVSPSEIIAEIAKARAISEPHSTACRVEDHRDCRVSWCGCACHPAVVDAVGSEADPGQFGIESDNPGSPWASIDMPRP